MLFNARRLFGSHSAASETFAGIPSAEETRALTDRLAEYQRLPDVADALARSLRGDTDGAVAALRARVAAHPDDGLAAYFLGTVCWTGRRVPDAVAQFTSALHHEPALAADPTLAHAVVAALSDRDASGAADALLRSAPLAQSPVAAQAAAEEAINGLTASARNRALVAAAGMASLLPRLDRARVMLRAADNCEDLRAALDQLDSLGAGDAADDARAVRAGECGSLRMRDRCQECVGGEGEDEHGRGRRGH
jgi:hypothetical protein